MTHPFHPQLGQDFEFVCRRSNWDTDWVYYFDDGGALCWIPASWTDAVPAHPAVALAHGRSAFLVEDLLALAAMLREADGSEL